MPSEPDDAETVAGSTSPGDTVAIDPPATLATSARRVLDARRAPEPDPVTIGRFRIVKRIGAGGMGVVYAAHDDELDRDVAIKLLRTNLAVDLSGRERLMREAQSIARLSHPNIVHVYEVGNDGDRVFMAMELIRGETLRVHCKGRPWREIVEVFLGAGEGLAAAHAESIIHRDFKPDNVIVDERGRARVVDFGLARAPVGSPELEGPPTEDLGPAVPTPTTGRRPLSVDLTGAGTVLGTPAYMAPEQLAKADPDARTDQFAFCVSLFEMLYERRPFKGSTYTEIARAVLTGLEVDTESGPRRIPRAVRRVILRGLSRSAEARFATMSELLVALRRASAPTQLRVVAYAAAAAAAGAVVVKLTSASPSESTAAADTAPQQPAAPLDPWAEFVAGTDLPDPVPTPLPGDPTDVSVHRLRNGLTLYVAPRPMEPKVSVTVAVRAGSEQERAWGPGLAFMVMNSIYRGTERIGVRDAALERPALLAQHRLLEALPAIEDPAAREAIILATTAAEHMGAEQGLPFDLTDAASALGGDLSGSRTGSGTTYALEVPAVRIEGGLALVAEAVQRPVFRGVVGLVRDQLDLYTSLTANDLAWQVVQRELAAATGLREDFESAGDYMRTLPLADAKALHTTYYRPNNAAVVMVGDVTPERAIALCEQYFGAWEPAAIPERAPLDAPLAGGVVRREIEDGGAPAVFVSWPLPPTDSPDYPAFVALADALDRQDGLGSALRERTGGASWDLTAYRSLDLRATARPDQSLVEVEFEIDLALRAIAEDTLPDASWEPALARAELARLRWARDPKNLTERIAASFIDRRPWSAVVAELSATPTRAELVGAARLLRERGRVVVHRRPGKTWVLPRFELPGVRPPERYGGQSSFARGIIDAPVAPPEPQFLVAGSHYTVRPRGAARFIAAELPGPLAVASWVYPYGVDDDPFVCDAIRARIWSVRIAGMDFDAYCSNDFVWVDVAAPAARFERDAALVFDWLDHGIPSESELNGHIERALAAREARRDSAAHRNPAFHAWALRGDAAIQAHMPSDAELRRGGPARLVEALERVDARAADVLYAGPGVERIAALVPEAPGKAAAVRTAAKLRAVPRDRIYVLDDPDREDIDVRISLPWPDLDPRTSLAAQIHSTAVAELSAEGPPSLALRWVSTPWWATIHPLAFHVEYFGRPEDAALAVTTGIGVLREPVPAARLEAERRRLEGSFRAHRTEMRRIPEVVRLWGVTTDPRVAEWLALPSLEAADMQRFYAALAEHRVVVSIVGDVRRLDLAALAGHGDVVQLDQDAVREILRDPNGSD